MVFQTFQPLFDLSSTTHPAVVGTLHVTSCWSIPSSIDAVFLASGLHLGCVPNVGVRPSGAAPGDYHIARAPQPAGKVSWASCATE